MQCAYCSHPAQEICECKKSFCHDHGSYIESPPHVVGYYCEECAARKRQWLARHQAENEAWVQQKADSTAAGGALRSLPLSRVGKRCFPALLVRER